MSHSHPSCHLLSRLSQVTFIQPSSFMLQVCGFRIFYLLFHPLVLNPAVEACQLAVPGPSSEIDLEGLEWSVGPNISNHPINQTSPQIAALGGFPHGLASAAWCVWGGFSPGARLS